MDSSAQHKTDFFFTTAKEQFIAWLVKKPTGKFTLEFNVNDGGIRGTPKISKTENINKEK